MSVGHLLERSSNICSEVGGLMDSDCPFLGRQQPDPCSLPLRHLIQRRHLTLKIFSFLFIFLSHTVHGSVRNLRSNHCAMYKPFYYTNILTCWGFSINLRKNLTYLTTFRGHAYWALTVSAHLGKLHICQGTHTKVFLIIWKTWCMIDSPQTLYFSFPQSNCH